MNKYVLSFLTILGFVLLLSFNYATINMQDCENFSGNNSCTIYFDNQGIEDAKDGAFVKDVVYELPKDFCAGPSTLKSCGGFRF